ncbi:hypothetical protein PTKIN_Ptkin08bG0104900 [Pterospermum kingtungense]
MVSFRVKNVCLLLLVLIICQEIFVVYNVEARHLRSKSCKKCSRQRYQNTLKIPKNANDSIRSAQDGHSSKVEYIDDFRPTTPGHSPGVGHSIKN